MNLQIDNRPGEIQKSTKHHNQEENKHYPLVQGINKRNKFFRGHIGRLQKYTLCNYIDRGHNQNIERIGLLVQRGRGLGLRYSGKHIGCMRRIGRIDRLGWM